MSSIFPVNWRLELEDGGQAVGREVVISRRKFPCCPEVVWTARVVILSLVVVIIILFSTLIIMTLVIIRLSQSGHSQEEDPRQHTPLEVIGSPPFSVLQYNILADYLADNGQPWFLLPLDVNETFRKKLVEKFYTKGENGVYAYNLRKNCIGELLPPDDCQKVKDYQSVFEWSRRVPMLMDVVRKMAADIFSLVELDHYEEFADAFPEYDSTFAKRPRRRSRDGSSLFWRRSRFEAVGEPIHEFFKDRAPDQFDDPEYKWSHDRVMTAIALREKTSQQILILASLHLMKSPELKENDAVRIIEASQVMHHIGCLKDEHNAAGIIILGDFNAFPGSYTHIFMLHGWQTCRTPDWQIQDVFSSTRMSNPTLCTSRTKARRLWLDYIFYSARTILPLEQPEVDECPEEPMPNSQHPSDHLPLKATLQFKAGATVPSRPQDLKKLSS